MIKDGYKKTSIGYIPLDWEVKKFKDITDILRCGLASTPKYVEDGVPFLSAQNVKNGKLNLDKYKCISNELHEKLTKNTKPQKNDILMTRVGNVGDAAIVDIDWEFSVYVSLTHIRMKEGYDSQFFTQLLNSSFIKRRSLQTQYKGGGVANLNVKVVEEFDMPIPPLKEQQKIVEILSSVDAAIKKTEQVIAKTEEVKKGLMQQLLTKGIGHTEFKQTEIGEIPLEWEVVSIESFSTVIRGASPRPKGDPRYYGGNVPRLMGADVTRDKKYVTPKIDFLTEEGAKLSRQMSKGDFVIVCSGTVGLPAILAIDACIHDGFLALKDINPKVSKEYLYYIFTQLRQQLDSKATHGGVFTNLTTQIVKEFKIALPSIDEQENISNILKGIDDKIDLEQKHMDKLSDIKKGLMQQLLTGKTRVKID